MKLNSLRYIREERGLSQAHLVELSGISRDSISAFETLKREPSPNTARRLADALGVEIADLAATSEERVRAARRASRYLVAWRAFIERIALHWDITGNEPTRAQISDVLIGLEQLIAVGTFDSDKVDDPVDEAELERLFQGVNKLRAIAERVGAKEEAARLREAVFVLESQGRGAA
jgi:transcriptional regulator with XRE-family HTH domain